MSTRFVASEGHIGLGAARRSLFANRRTLCLLEKQPTPSYRAGFAAYMFQLAPPGPRPVLHRRDDQARHSGLLALRGPASRAGLIQTDTTVRGSKDVVHNRLARWRVHRTEVRGVVDRQHGDASVVRADPSGGEGLDARAFHRSHSALSRRGRETSPHEAYPAGASFADGRSRLIRLCELPSWIHSAPQRSQEPLGRRPMITRILDESHTGQRSMATPTYLTWR